MPSFRKKPVIVEAERLDKPVVIETLEGEMKAGAVIGSSKVSGESSIPVRTTSSVRLTNLLTRTAYTLSSPACPKSQTSACVFHFLASIQWRSHNGLGKRLAIG